MKGFQVIKQLIFDFRWSILTRDENGLVWIVGFILDVINIAYNKYLGEVIDTIGVDETVNLVLFIENIEADSES